MVSSVGELRELHKKFSQSLRVLPENSFDWKFLKVGSQLKFIVLFKKMFARSCPSHIYDYQGCLTVYV